MPRCPDCGENFYDLHFCSCKPSGIVITSEMIKKVVSWWSKKFNKIHNDSKPLDK
jgi:hypothetical protein